MSTSNENTHKSNNSYHDLCLDLAKHVISFNSNANKKCVIAIAGGGSTSISSILSIPNSSSFLMEGNIPYDRISFAKFVDPNSKVNISPNFYFSSKEAALLLAKASYQRAQDMTDIINNNNNNDKIFGIGCTSMLITSQGTRKTKRDPHIHICITDDDDNQAYTLDCTLQMRQDNSEQDEDKLRRIQEEMFSCVILIHILDYFTKSNTSSNVEVIEGIISSYLEKLQQNSYFHMDIQQNNEYTPSSSHTDITNATIISDEATKIIAGESSKVILLGKKQQDQRINLKPISMTPRTQTLPDESIIFPGSFNPIHAGHLTLAKAATNAVSRKMNKNKNTNENENPSVKNTIWDFITPSASTTPSSPPPIFFELSITNPDKPPMEIHQVQQRAEWIVQEFSSKDNDSSLGIQNWGIILDSAPLFAQKVDLLTSSSKTQIKKTLNFVIGVDTMIRIIDPKYYGGMQGMLDAVRGMKEKGVHFIVGGRLDQRKDIDKVIFMNGEAEVKEMPEDIQDMFTLLAEDEFRVDLSSTEIRKQREKEKAETAKDKK